MTLLRQLYAHALKLYPRSFRRKFGDELLDVFAIHINGRYRIWFNNGEGRFNDY